MSLKVWSSPDSENEEEEKIDTDDIHSSDPDRLENLSSIVFSLWHKRQLHMNTNFTVTGCMLCVTLHVLKDENIVQIVIIGNRSTIQSKYFHG